MSIPEEYGGGGADPLTYCLFIEELSRGDANVRSIMSVHLGLVAGSIDRWGTEEQKQQWLPRMATGEVLGCFGLTEPDHGSNPADLRATAEARPGGGWRISGRKVFITNGSIAQVALVMARTGGPGAKGVSAFLVPTDRARLHREPAARQARAAVLRHRRAGARRRRGRARGAARRGGRTGSRWRCPRWTTAGCRSRRPAPASPSRRWTSWSRTPGSGEQFGKPIAGHQLVQEMLADSAVDVDASRLLTWAVADLKTRGERYSLAASKAKLFATEASIRVANNCIQVHGGYGYVDEYPAAKLLRDARVTTLYEGTSQVQKLLIGRALTGHQRVLTGRRPARPPRPSVGRRTVAGKQRRPASVARSRCNRNYRRRRCRCPTVRGRP